MKHSKLSCHASVDSSVFLCLCARLDVAADGVGSLGAEQNHLSIPVTDHEAWATAMNNLGIVPVGISGQQLVSGAVASLTAK